MAAAAWETIAKFTWLDFVNVGGLMLAGVAEWVLKPTWPSAGPVDQPLTIKEGLTPRNV